MSNIDKAVEVIRREFEDDSKVYDEYSVSSALYNAGLLAPAPQIIRTAQELDAIDDDTLLSTVAEHDGGCLARSARFIRRCYLTDDEDQAWPLPAVVVATGEHVRACREALEGETGQEDDI